MGFPGDVGVIDLMFGFPKRSEADNFRFGKGALKDDESQAMQMPAEYMFRHVPGYVPEAADPIAVAIGEMDHCGVARAMVHIGNEIADRAMVDHPDRFIPAVDVDPSDVMVAVRRIREAREQWAIKAVTSFPAGALPQVPIDDRLYYPVYATCVELDLPIVINAGVPGPRVPAWCQHVEHLDRVCYDFPELRIVMRHGAEPWTDLAVKLMLKWPGLHYATSAFAPKYYPKAVIHYANTRGADKVMYAGYYPMGLSLRRIFDELPQVPLDDAVWPKFLRDNAVRVFNLDPDPA
jgi:predicted TIM-barrel fold metal-dependent hydrolase